MLERPLDDPTAVSSYRRETISGRDRRSGVNLSCRGCNGAVRPAPHPDRQPELEPGHDTRLSDTQSAFQGRKRVADLSAPWTFDPSLRLRLSAINLGPLDDVTATSIDAADLRETSGTVARSYTMWQWRLEMTL